MQKFFINKILFALYMECLFCAIANKKTKSILVYEDDILVVVMDIAPASWGHMLVIPKKHYETSFHIPDDEYEHMVNVARKAAMVAMDVTQSGGVNIFDRVGEAAGQRIPHASLHVIPRNKNDGIQLGWQPKKADQNTLNSLASKIKVAMSNMQIKPKEKIVERKPKKEIVIEKKLKKNEVIHLQPRIPRP